MKSGQRSLTAATAVLCRLKVMRLFRVLLLSVLAALAAGHTYFSPLDFLHHERALVRREASIELHVAPTLLQTSGEWVTVTWENVPDPSNDDWVGVYSPPYNGTIDPVNHAPIKYQYANFSPTHSEGKGMLKFRLVNMRDNVIMGFFRGGFENPVLVAVSEIVQFQNQNEPLQGHLLLTKDPTVMILMWVTRKAFKPQVLLTQPPATYIRAIQATSSTYSAKDMCGGVATGFGFRETGLLHQAILTALTPGAKFHYRFGDSAYGWSKEYIFTAAPKPGPDVTVRVVAYGDMGNGQEDDSRQTDPAQQPALNTSRLVLDQINMTDLVLHIGDISYARGYASVWDEFFDEIQPIATRVPYMVCIGNHERDWPNSGSYYNGTDSGGECGVAYERRFPMPRPSLDEAWYGFDYGSVHFVLMSTEHDFRVGSPQYKFLENHLKEVHRSVTPWLVFAGHRPMYIDSTNNAEPAGDLPVAQLLRQNVEPLLKDYKVDLALWGHHHSYQRTCPVYQEVCTEGAPTHIVIGMGGQGLSQNIKPVKPSWIEVVDDQHWGFSRFTVNATTLVFEFVRDLDGQVHDSVVLKK